MLHVSFNACRMKSMPYDIILYLCTQNIIINNNKKQKQSKMRRITLAIVFACCTLTLAAQDAIRVNYRGAQPTISDFVTAFVSSRDHDEEEDCADESFNAICQAWDQHLKGLPSEEGVTLTVDQKNGYVVYEYRSEYESVVHIVRIEMCYWNEADKKHKLFAYNVSCFRNGEYSTGQFDGLQFYRYNNATKKMTYCTDTGFDVIYGEDGASVSYDLPHTGKDIIVNYWYDSGKRQKTLKWNGRRFSLNP